MPWKNVTPMEEIIRFVMLAQSDRFTVTDLCEQFGISRKTGYKHLERYAATGLKGLQPRSHRPHQFPQRTDEAIEDFDSRGTPAPSHVGAEEAAQGLAGETWRRGAASVTK